MNISSILGIYTYTHGVIFIFIKKEELKLHVVYAIVAITYNKYIKFTVKSGITVNVCYNKYRINVKNAFPSSYSNTKCICRLFAFRNTYFSPI